MPVIRVAKGSLNAMVSVLSDRAAEIKGLSAYEALADALQYRNIVEDDIAVPRGVALPDCEDEFAASPVSTSQQFQDWAQPVPICVNSTTSFLGKASVVRWIEELTTKMTDYFGPAS
ncbi:uncharacterized protein PADG_12191 [Paracoccidioides brasiliensis Pb18]|uniref:Uncharacterized protein n=2 Tax=Paracoccidioides brasiliensis TaxID=121759 RepID=A0A0A0HTY4_PARBD|nr:uncharacterized protein PADG_12191 [Paracoccidioides brasiliensis Pb18]KGM91733.1 hypothetical protein PADG_12191 [Paracoccidioides brasiliensis Pb18]ODH39360.1 hypothetical protein ACO22_01928 [Paracoccidioides brasiliensis]ODH47634.1 hypothetical protein GX48_06251 [Paracoccidioides brasiliensis]